MAYGLCCTLSAITLSTKLGFKDSKSYIKLIQKATTFMKTHELNSFIWIDKNTLEVGGDVKAHEYNSIQATQTPSTPFHTSI